MSFAEPRQPHRRSSLPMAPMLDVIFLLLIFFVVTSSLHEQERQIDIDLPSAESAEPGEGSRSQVVINVQDDGTLMLGSVAYQPSDLAAALRVLVEDNPDERVIIRGDRDARYERIVAAMDIARAAGVRHLYFATIQHRDD